MTRTIVVVAVAASALAALAPSASSRATGETLRGRIVPGKSIGPLRLGMSGAAATRTLGRRFGEPDVGKRERRGTANAYVELEYPAFFSSYSVGLRGRPGNRRVVRITVMIAGNKTPDGVGVGTTEERLRRAYRGRLRCRYLRDRWQIRECRLGQPNERHTLFELSGGTSFGGRASDPPIVVRVIVTEPPRAGGPSGKGDH